MTLGAPVVINFKENTNHLEQSRDPNKRDWLTMSRDNLCGFRLHYSPKINMRRFQQWSHLSHYELFEAKATVYEPLFFYLLAQGLVYR